MPERILGYSLRVAMALYALLRNRQFRSYQLAKLRNPDEVMQGSSYTYSERYPRLFDASQEELNRIFPNDQVVRLLSFGCGTGEELIALRERFPAATIVGADINRWCRQQCQSRIRDPRTFLVDPTTLSYKQEPSFHAIYCLAVLQHSENRRLPVDWPARRFRFDQFEKALRDLDKKLITNGLLILDHCDFEFLDIELSKRYEPVGEPRPWREDRVLYASDNRRKTPPQSYHRIFRKLR